MRDGIRLLVRTGFRLILFGLSALLLSAVAVAVSSCRSEVQLLGGRVRIHVSVSDDLRTYTGWVPITVGLPIPRGEMMPGAVVRLVQRFGARRLDVPVQHRVTARWPEAHREGGGTVKWLLVDALVWLDRGDEGLLHLEFTNDLQDSPQASFDWATGFAARIAEGDGPPQGSLDPSVIGRFGFAMAPELGSGEGEFFTAEPRTPVLETTGSVRSVLRIEGNYVGPANQQVGEFTTRLTLFSGQPYVRIHHTLVWGRDGMGADLAAPRGEADFDYERLFRALTFRVPRSADGPCGVVEMGTKLHGTVHAPQCAPMTFAQVSEGEVERGDSTGVVREAGHLDGWLRVLSRSDAREGTFVGLRSAAEQFPSGFQIDERGNVDVALLRPDRQNWWQLSSNDDTSGGFDVETSFPNRPLSESPIGIAKTYELLLWPNADEPRIHNAFAQNGIHAYADPAFVLRSGIPLRTAPRDCGGACPPAREAVERAIEDAFAFMTRTTNPGPTGGPGRTRLGALHFGDVFKDWNPRTPDDNYAFPRKYWMNTGTGFSELPWLLWMRSGDRVYRDFAEANARHVMDVDTMHIDRAVEGLAKRRGAQTQYLYTHGGFVLIHGDVDTVAKSAESGGIALAWYLTGDGRAHDVLLERGRLFARQWESRQSALHQQLDELTSPSSPRPFGYEQGASPASSDGPQGHQRTLGELAVLHMAVGETYPSLRDAGTAYLEAILALQSDEDGWMPPARPHYAEHGLLTAAQAFPEYADDVRRALARWASYSGRPGRPSDSGKAGGPRSLEAGVALYDEIGDARWLRYLEGAVYGQARAVLNLDDLDGEGEAWRGITAIGPHLLPDVLRGWLAVLALRDGDIHTAIPPMPYVRYNTAAGTLSEDVVRLYAEKPAGEDLLVPIDFALFENSGDLRRPVLIRSHPPLDAYDGSAIAEPDTREYCVTWRAARWAARRVGYDQPLGSGACAQEGLPPGESLMHSIPEAWVDVGGTFRFDAALSRYATSDPESGLTAAAFHAESVLVRRVPNRALSLDGSRPLRLAPSSAHRATNKMTIAVQLAPSGANRMVVLKNGAAYQLTVEGHRLTATFGLITKAGEIRTLAATVEGELDPDGYIPAIARVRVDERAAPLVHLDARIRHALVDLRLVQPLGLGALLGE